MFSFVPMRDYDSEDDVNKHVACDNSLYFKTTDSTTCYPLSHYLHDAKVEGEEELTLICAVADADKDYIYCSYWGEVGERNSCRKRFCSAYSSKSGRGVCKHRGKLYVYGEEVAFYVATGKLKNTK